MITKTILVSYVAKMGFQNKEMLKTMIDIVLGSFVTLEMKTQVKCIESSTRVCLFHLATQ